MKHTIQVLVENKFGVLARIASLFSARGYNIDSLAVGETQDESVSCMTIVVNAPDERILEQIKKQLHKLIDVTTVVDFTRKEYFSSELMLIKIANSKENKSSISNLSKDFSITVIDENKDCLILEVCAKKDEGELLLKTLNKLGVLELIRTGKIAIGK